jgi:signal transduction histidine kinase/ligand-binding sensor domain-containing protein
MQMTRSGSAFALFFLTCLNILLLMREDAVSQHYLTRTYTEADGLYSSLVMGITQDTSGKIWIARRSGISSYDGLEFVNYGVPDGLKATSYAFLSVDERGNLWGFPDAGTPAVSRFDGKRWITKVFRQGLGQGFECNYSAFVQYFDGPDTVFAIGTQKDGIVFFGNRLDGTRITTAQGLSGNAVQCMVRFANDLYVGTDKGLSIVRNGKVLNAPVQTSNLPAGSVRAMVVDGTNLWILGNDWLGFLFDHVFHRIEVNFYIPLLPTLNRAFITIDHEGNIYFGNPYVVYCHSLLSSRTQQLDRENGLISPGGTSVMIDREKNVWVTGYRGISKIGSKRFISYYQTDGLFDNEVASALEIRPGNFVFGHDGALTFWDGSAFTQKVIGPANDIGNYETRILDLDKDRQGNLWIAASSLGVARMTPAKGITWYNMKNNLKGIAYTVAVTPGGIVYTGTPKGLFTLEGDQFVPALPPNLQIRGIRKIFHGSGEEIFIATLGEGMIRLNDQKIDTFHNEREPGAENAFFYLNDRKGRNWVGTSAGLYTIQNNQLEKVEINGLKVDRPVYAITEDRMGNLWFGTDNGVFRWNGNRMDHFTTTDGLSGLEINRDAFLTDIAGNVIMGTNNGLTIFRPGEDFDPGALPVPEVGIAGIEAGNRMYLAGETIELPSNITSLVVRFTILSFIDERKNSFRYMIENLDTAWSDVLPYKENKLRLSTLPHGKYRILIKGCNALGVWSEPVSSAWIIIERPFWYQWWFIVPLALFIGLLSFISGRFVLIYRMNTRLEKLVGQRTAELQESNAAKDRFFSIIAHDLKNPFHFILGILELLNSGDSNFTRKETEEMLVKLQKTSRNTMDLLENLLTWARSQKGLVPFNPEKVQLSGVIDDAFSFVEPLAKQKNIAFGKKVSDAVSVFADPDMLHTILRNLVSNAVKFTPPGGRITIEVTGNDGMSVIAVTDNGCGIPASVQEKLFRIDERVSTRGTANETGTGLGLILCKEFVEKNKGTIKVNSEVGKGSTFLVTFPSS